MTSISATSLAVNRGTLETPDANWTDVTVTVRDGTASAISRQGDTLVSKDGVTVVEKLVGRPKAYQVSFGDGVVWTAVKQGCGCGGGR